MVLGLDPHCDTPLELLHTILLGIVKYVWYASHSNWSDLQKDTFIIRLNGSNTNGLTGLTTIDGAHIMQHCNSLLGRQLKIILQLSTFHIHDLVGSPTFTIWKAIGFLSALLWFPEITDLEVYLVSHSHLIIGSN